MDLRHAITAHLDWKLKLRGAIGKQETVETESIAHDTCCDLGRWLYAEARTKHGSTAEYRALLARHQVFHREAAKVADLINTRQYEQATRALDPGSTYASASTAVGAAIKAMQKVAG